MFREGDHRQGPETERLQHRAMVPGDAEAVIGFNGDPEVMRHTGEPLWTSVEEARKRLAAYPDFDRHGFGRWGCVFKPEGKVIGFSGLKYLPELDEVDIGYRLARAYWGRGLATESTRACLRYGFEVLALERIIGLVEPENEPSVRVLRKLGLRDTGTIDYDGITAHRFVLERADFET